MHLFSSHFALLSFLSLFPTTIPAQASLTRFLSIYTTALPSPGVLTQIPTTSFTNPSKAGFWIYVPKNLAPKPALLVAIHYCTGTAEAYFKNSPYGNLAEKYGYIVVYPSSPNSGTCWDVSSAASLSNGEKGDSGSIVGMVKWTLRNHATIDASKVFVLGTSSGAMMTVLLCLALPSSSRLI
jgi:acetylxylan esterase